MLSKFFSTLYTKVFVNIIINRSETHVYIEVCNNKKIIDEAQEIFPTHSLSVNMYDFIDKYISETPYFYISFLDTSASQGALPTCDTKKMSIYRDMSSFKYLCYQNKWSYYTSEIDLNLLQQNYEKIGIDFIFSPYVVLANFFKDKINSALAMFILIEDNYLSLAIFDHGELLFAEYLDMEHHKDFDDLAIESLDEDISEELDLDGSIDLEEIGAIDDMDDLDDLGDIEDLDSFEEIEDFSEDKEVEQDIVEQDHSADNEKGFNEDYQRFSLIQNSINHYYKDPKYNSKFIESVYIADGIKVSNDLKRYLEEEMFLGVYIRNIDLSVEICEHAKAELK